MGILLSIIAILLSWILFPISLCYTFLKLFIQLRPVDMWIHINSMFKSIAISIDQLGNVVCQHLFNDFLIKKDGYKFGNTDDTISFVLGANHILDRLTRCGNRLCAILNFFDDNHVVKTYESNS